jgi:hypothetical protein
MVPVGGKSKEYLGFDPSFGAVNAKIVIFDAIIRQKFNKGVGKWPIKRCAPNTGHTISI